MQAIMLMNQKRPGLRHAVLYYVPIYLACAFAAGLFYRYPNLLLVIYLAMTAVLLWCWHTQGDLFYFFVPFLLGPLAEIFAVHFGAWHYTDSYFEIPIWLPFAWGIAMIFMKKTAEALLSLEKPASEQMQLNSPPIDQQSQIEQARLTLLGDLLKQRVQLETDILRYILQAFALYLAITAGLLKFSLDASATPSLRLALIILGVGLSVIGLSSCILAVRLGSYMAKEAANLAQGLGLEKNPVSFLFMKYLASFIGGFVAITLLGWIYIWFAGVGLY
jgi:hypothetical protein